MSEEFFNWQMTCDRFALEGDARGMRACAAEVRALTVPGAAAEADAMEAEAALKARSGWRGRQSPKTRTTSVAISHSRARWARSSSCWRNCRCSRR